MLKERKKKLRGSQAPKVVNREVCSILTMGTRTYCYLDQLIFQQEHSSAEVRVRARRLPGRTDEERQLMEIGAAVGIPNLKTNRATGEKFACSVVNFAAMIYGQDAGQLGGSAKVMKKVFTGASWWGTGEDGWEKFDHTALVKDQRNSLGIVVQEQGRVIWRVADGPVLANLESKPPPVRNAWTWCCRRRRPAVDKSEAVMHLAKHAF